MFIHPWDHDHHKCWCNQECYYARKSKSHYCVESRITSHFTEILNAISFYWKVLLMVISYHIPSLWRRDKNIKFVSKVEKISNWHGLTTFKLLICKSRLDNCYIPLCNQIFENFVIKSINNLKLNSLIGQLYMLPKGIPNYKVAGQ